MAAEAVDAGVEYISQGMAEKASKPAASKTGWQSETEAELSPATGAKIVLEQVTIGDIEAYVTAI